MTGSRFRLSLAIVNVVALILVVVVNVLATTVPLGGMTTGQLSDLYANLFVPTGLTFSIWGVIYILLAVYVVYSLAFSLKQATPAHTFLEQSAVLFTISCAANAGWIFCWQYRVLPLSLVCMVVLLASLVAIYVRLNVGRTSTTASEKYMVHLPVSVYLGWISIATIANVAALLVYYKWQRFGLSEQFWTIVMVGIGVVLGIVFLLYRRDIFYALVIDWAVLGILLKRTATAVPKAEGVIITAIAGICLLSVGIIAQLIRGRVYK